MLMQSLNTNSIESWLSTILAKVSPVTYYGKAVSQVKTNVFDKLDKMEKLKQLKEFKQKVNKAINYLQKEIIRNPRKVMDLFDKKLNVQEKRKISNVLSSNNEGAQVFLSSSWIQWAIWVPISEKSNKGVLTLKLRTKSFNNPSGVYTFPLHGHPHGYGNYVDRSVYEILKFSSSAGTDFWRVFYRSWYNTHRGVNYLQAPKKQ